MSTPDGLATTRPEKRRRLERVAAACDLCKKRKVKCDGEQPCAYCTRKDRAATCTFSGHHARPQAHSASHAPLHALRSDDIHRPHPRSTVHTPNNRDRDEQDGAARQRLEREAAEDETSLSPTLSRDDQQGDTVVPLEGRILRDAQGKSIFIGDCAPLSFLQTVRHLITSEVDPRATVQATRDPIIEIARPDSADQHSCPPIDVHQIDALVDEFMAASSGLVQLFQREDLAPELKAWASSRNSSSDDAAAAVFYLVLAIGAQERFEEKAEAWFNTARDVLLKHMCSSMNVSTVQGFALVAIYMLRASQPNGAYLYFCMRNEKELAVHNTLTCFSPGCACRIRNRHTPNGSERILWRNHQAGARPDLEEHSRHRPVDKVRYHYRCPRPKSHTLWRHHSFTLVVYADPLRPRVATH